MNLYPIYANVGPALAGLNLFHAAQWGKLKKGDKVLVYSIGSVSSCCAVVMRWGDVALGEAPAGVELADLQAAENEYAELEAAAVERRMAEAAA
jgi:3-oxoacyl-[acyl-carrier-protein] synthase-3